MINSHSETLGLNARSLGNFSLPIEANEGVEERLNVSLSRNEGRAVPCSTEVKEGWGEGPLKNLIPRELKNSKT